MPQISIIKKSDIQEARRFDAEFFKPEYVRESKIINSYKHITIDEFAFITDGQHGYHEVDKSSDIAHLTARHMKNWFASKEGAEMLAKWVDDKNKRSSLEEGDVILSTRGSVGHSAIVKKEILPANIDQDVARIKININSQILPNFLIAYLNSYFGQNWIKKNCTGMVQQGLSLQKVREIKIPILPQSFQLQIEKIVKSAYEKQTRSKQLYKEAEELLLKEVDLLDYKPEHILSFETTKKETDEAGRFDAEYFQPKYEEIIKKIENYEGGFDVAKNILNFNKKNFFSKENELYNYIPLSRVLNSGEIEIPEKEFGKDLPTRARRKVKKGEIILSSISGSLETSAIIAEEHQNFIVSNGFYVFNSEKINSETLLVLFKSKTIIALLQRISKGAILGGYDLTAFEKFKIPLIDLKIQKQIAKKITESHKLKKESKELLEEAKRKVEEEIEKN